MGGGEGEEGTRGGRVDETSREVRVGKVHERREGRWEEGEAVS